MRFSEFKNRIDEGQGLKSAKPGEVYLDAQETPYMFQDWDYKYPRDKLKYDSLVELSNDVEEVQKSNPQVDFRFFNSPNSRTRSFAFAKFKSEDNKEIWLGKFFTSVNPNNTILDKDAKILNLFPSTEKNSEIKATAKMQPSDFGLADNRNRSVNQVIKSVDNHTHSNVLSNALKFAASNQPIIFENIGELLPAVQDDFGEVLSPIAIINGHETVSGPIDVAVKDIFKGENIHGAAINFPSEQNNPLIDSYIVIGNLQMGISHKGKKGAKASITNIWKALQEASQTKNGQEYMRKFSTAVEILNICQEQSQEAQPIILAEKFNLLSSEEISKLKELMKNPKDESLILTGDLQNPNRVLRVPTNFDMQKIPLELERLFRLGGYKSGSFVSYICLARTAKLVADFINQDSRIDFGEAVRSILNSSAMIQASTIATKRQNDILIKSINVVYPPQFQGKVKMEHNSYYGTGIKSKFSFSLPST